MRLINYIRSHIHADFFFLLSCLSYINIFYFSQSFNFYFSADTLKFFHSFYFFYNEYFVNGSIPFWMPYSLYGIQFDHYIITDISFAQYFMAFVGRFLSIKDSFTVCIASMVIEEMALLVGVYLLGRRLFHNKLTVIFVCIGSIFTISWGVQVWFNFRIYYLIPLCLFFIIKFFDYYKFSYLWFAGIIVVISYIGNLQYFIPLHFFVYVLFTCILFITKKERNGFDITNIFKPASLILLFIFFLLSFVFLDYTTHVFDYTMPYSPGRDPATRKVSLDSFLTYGAKNDLGKFLEFIYAATISYDFAVYIGLIPLLFLIYGLFRSGDNPYFKAITITAIVVMVFSISYHSFVATFLYYFSPAMKYYRHVGYVVSIAKILLLIASGFGLDYYFRRMESTGNGKEFLPAIIGFFLAAAIIFMDVLFKFNYPYSVVETHHASKDLYQGNMVLQIPYQFHFLPLMILIYLAVSLWKKSLNNTGRKTFNVIIMLYLFEIASYNFILFYTSPIKAPFLPVNPLMTVEEYNENIEKYKATFHVRSYDFQNKRLDRGQINSLRPEMPARLRFVGEYPNIYSAFYVDSCLQEYRVDFMPLSFDRLVRARLGVILDKPLMGGFPDINILSKDAVFMNAIGCNTSKILFVSHPNIVHNLDTAARMIKVSSDLDKNPIILAGPIRHLTPPQHLTDKKDNSFINVQTKGPFETENIAKSLEVNYDIVRFTANMLKVVANVGSTDDVWLIYLDNYHPGWKATVNGQPRPIAQANLAFKAVRLDKGQNVVRFTFNNLRSKIYANIFFVVGVVSSLVLIVSIVFLSMPFFFSHILEVEKKKRE